MVYSIISRYSLRSTFLYREVFASFASFVSFVSFEVYRGIRKQKEKD
jgi:hypothetical protein